MVNNIDQLIKTHKEYHWDFKIIGIEAAEVFVAAPEVQYCGPIKITMDIPFSYINFNKNAALAALRVLSLKIDPGYYKYDVKTYINETEFSFNADNITTNIEEYLNLIKDKNCITIFFKSKYNFTYTKQILIYPVENETDENYFNIEIQRWMAEKK